MQQLILGTGTAIWWLTEPHSWVTQESTQAKQPTVVVLGLALKYSGSKWKSTLDVMLKVPQKIFLIIDTWDECYKNFFQTLVHDSAK